MKAAELAALARNCESTAKVLKALAHTQRLHLLCHLMDGEKSVTELERLCEISQSQLSQFLQRMRAEGLVSSRREGKFVYYSIGDVRILKLIRSLHSIYRDFN